MKNKYRTALIVASLIVSCLYLVYNLQTNALMYTLQRRFIKIVAIWLCSYLATSATVYFQIVSQNQILTPSILGFERLYLLIQVVVVFVSQSLLPPKFNFLVSVSLMVLLGTGFYGLILSRINKDFHALLLLGVVIGALLSSVTSTLKMMMDANEFSIVQAQSYASFNGVNTSVLALTVVLLVPVIVLIRSFKTEFDVVALGTNYAHNLGINMNKFQIKTLVIVSCFSALSTALVGPVGFLGLISSHISRLCVKNHSTQGIIEFGTMFIGVLLVVSQLLFEHVLHLNTSVSVILNILGGITFVVLLLKENYHD